MTNTIRRTLHLLLDMPIGIVAFTAAFTPVGVRWIAPLERRRARTLLGVTDSEPKSAWRAAAYSLAMLPVGVTTSTIAMTGWVTGAWALTYPAFAPFLDKTAVTIGSTTVGGPGWQVATSVAGALLLLAMPAVIRGLSRIDAAMVRRLL